MVDEPSAGRVQGLTVYHASSVVTVRRFAGGPGAGMAGCELGDRRLAGTRSEQPGLRPECVPTRHPPGTSRVVARPDSSGRVAGRDGNGPGRLGTGPITQASPAMSAVAWPGNRRRGLDTTGDVNGRREG